MDDAMFRFGQMMSLCAAHELEHPGEGAKVYEDEDVTVEYKDGYCVITGKPIRYPFIYVTVQGIQ